MNRQETASDLALAPDLQYAREEFERARVRVQESFGVLDDDTMNRRADPDRWSVAECLEHLCVTAEQYLPGIDSAIAQAKTENRRATPPFKYNIFHRWYERQLDERVRLKMKSPKVFRPVTRRGADDIRRRFSRIQGELADRALAANGYDLRRVTLRSPVVRWLRLPLGIVFRMLAAHQRRHLNQAEQVLKDLRPPRR